MHLPELGSVNVPQIKLPTSKRTTATTKVILILKCLYALPHADWNMAKVMKNAAAYQPTSGADYGGYQFGAHQCCQYSKTNMEIIRDTWDRSCDDGHIKGDLGYNWLACKWCYRSPAHSPRTCSIARRRRPEKTAARFDSQIQALLDHSR